MKQLIEDVQTNEKLMNADTASKEALDTAIKIRKKKDESEKKINQYVDYRATLKLPHEEIPELEKFDYIYNLRHQIWHIRQTFGEQEQGWFRNNFREQDA